MTMLENGRPSGKKSSKVSTSLNTMQSLRDTTVIQSGTCTSGSAQKSHTTATINGGETPAKKPDSKHPLSTSTTTTTSSDWLGAIARNHQKKTQNASEEKDSLTNNLSSDDYNTKKDLEDNALSVMPIDSTTFIQTNSKSYLEPKWPNSTQTTERLQSLRSLMMDGPSRGRKKERPNCINTCTEIDRDTNIPCKDVYRFGCCPWKPCIDCMYD